MSIFTRVSVCNIICNNVYFSAVTGHSFWIYYDLTVWPSFSRIDAKSSLRAMRPMVLAGGTRPLTGHWNSMIEWTLKPRSELIIYWSGKTVSQRLRLSLYNFFIPSLTVYLNIPFEQCHFFKKRYPWFSLKEDPLLKMLLAERVLLLSNCLLILDRRYRWSLRRRVVWTPGSSSKTDPRLADLDKPIRHSSARCSEHSDGFEMLDS